MSPPQDKHLGLITTLALVIKTSGFGVAVLELVSRRFIIIALGAAQSPGELYTPKHLTLGIKIAMKLLK